MTTSMLISWNRFVRPIKRPIWHAVYRLTGRRMGSSVNFLDMSMAGAVFRLAPEQATRLVANDSFVPSIAKDGLARCHVTALEYRNVDILYPYNELAVTIPGKMRTVDRDSELHFYLHLPVTTEDARWTGVEIYGFPKYIAAIDFEHSESEVVCSLTLAGQEVLTLRVNTGVAVSDDWQIQNLTFLDGEPILSSFRGHGQRYASDIPGGARLHLGQEPIAQGLRSAGIEPTSVSHFYCPSMRASLSPPVKPKRLSSKTRI